MKVTNNSIELIMRNRVIKVGVLFLRFFYAFFYAGVLFLRVLFYAFFTRKLHGLSCTQPNELILHASELFDLRAYEYTVMHK